MNDSLMNDRLIRPSMKSVGAVYLLALIVLAAGIWAYYRYATDEPAWLMALPLVAFLIPLKMHLQRRSVTLRLHEGHLTIESGFLSRTRRTVDMAKIQDVTVSQTLGQRLWGVGDLRLESAGERRHGYPQRGPAQENRGYDPCRCKPAVHFSEHPSGFPG